MRAAFQCCFSAYQRPPPLPVARSSPSAPLPTPACPLPHPRDVHSLKPGDRVHSQFYRCPDRADARSFRTFASPHPPFLPSSLPIDRPPSNAVPRAAINPTTISISLLAVTSFDSVARPRVRRSATGFREPTSPVRRCRGKMSRRRCRLGDRKRYESIRDDRNREFVPRSKLRLVCRTYRFASFSSFERFVARKIQLLDIRTRRSRLNLVRKSGRSNQSGRYFAAVAHFHVLRGRVET